MSQKLSAQPPLFSTHANAWRPRPDDDVILSASGGKDSTAAGLHLLELGIPFRAVFYDTGWEHEETYRYVESALPGVLGVPVETRRGELPDLSAEMEAVALDLERRYLNGRVSLMVRWCIHKAMFPSPVRARWCTEKFKINAAASVSAESHRAGRTPVAVVGIRHDESAARAGLAETDIAVGPSLDALVWRPILKWTLEDVIAIHARHNATPNPLYLRYGVGRVGCWPCVGAGKTELRALAAFDPRRVALVEELERVVGDEEARRRAKRPRKRRGGGSYTTRPAMFRLGTRNAEGVRPCTPIREMLAWSQTKRGGRVLDDAPIDTGSGCMRWGLCERGDGGTE